MTMMASRMKLHAVSTVMMRNRMVGAGSVRCLP